MLVVSACKAGLLLNIQQEEISAITKKRSEFEHKVNAPGCKSIDYARYAEWVKMCEYDIYIAAYGEVGMK